MAQCMRRHSCIRSFHFIQLPKAKEDFGKKDRYKCYQPKKLSANEILKVLVLQNQSAGSNYKRGTEGEELSVRDALTEVDIVLSRE